MNGWKHKNEPGNFKMNGWKHKNEPGNFKMKDFKTDGWTEEIFPNPGYKICCCDCGLVHNIEFLIWRIGPRTKVTGGKTSFELKETLDPNRHQVSMRVRRNTRATSQVRRYNNNKEKIPNK